MKFLDKVKILADRPEYAKHEVFKGMIGTIMGAEIRDNTFDVIFIDPRYYDEMFEWTEESACSLKPDIFCPIRIEDMDVVEDGHCSDEWILQDIPKNNPKWWCKVENGYIINLLGEKKNKIPYDYNS